MTVQLVVSFTGLLLLGCCRAMLSKPIERETSYTVFYGECYWSNKSVRFLLRGLPAAWGLFHKTLRIRNLQICSYGQILTVNLLENCQNTVIYSHFVVNYEEKSFMEEAPG